MDDARRIADAVLYEGYLLYPYRASAVKNQMRWQFGVLVPRGFTATAEPSASRTECLLEGPADATAVSRTVLRLRLRFLHLRSRAVQRACHDGYRTVPELAVGDAVHLSFDEATAREAQVVLPLAALLDTGHTTEVGVPGDRVVEHLREGPVIRGRILSEHLSLRARLRIRAERLAGPHGLVKVGVDVQNTAAWEEGDAPRERALRRSLIGTHLLIGVHGARFVSLLDPPEWARTAAADCRNEHTWPVLAGEPGRRDVLLSSPIILYDHPAIAPESPGELFDSTEMDELLSLRTLTLTEREKREARATDPRAAEIVARVGDLPPETVERMHGAIRGPDMSVPRDPPARPAPAAGTAAATPWWDPDADSRPCPETDHVLVQGVPVGKGSRVVLRPGRRRADAHDMFLAGRTALVEAVLLDVDGGRHLAITLVDDPGADLHRAYGRFRYFAPDEVEPLPEEPDETGDVPGEGAAS
jgi:hypothetical protein